MRIEQFEILMETQLPKLFGLCSALTPNLKFAEQLFMDAYTVFVVEEKEFLATENFETTNQSERLSVKRYLFNSMSRQIIELASKKSKYFEAVPNSKILEYKNFFELKNNHKAILFLKEKLKVDLKDLQEIFELQSYQVKEVFHNALHKLNENSVIQEETYDLEMSLKYLVNSLVNKTLSPKLILSIEEEINSNKNLYDYYQERLRQQEFFESLIPERTLSRPSRAELIESMNKVNLDIFPKEKLYFIHKLTKFLTTPVIEI